MNALPPLQLPPIHLLQTKDGEKDGRRTSDKFIEYLKMHIEEEMERHGNVLDRIEDLVRSVDGLKSESRAFHETVKRAFPMNEFQMPDYEGHRMDHAVRMSDAKDAKELKQYVRKVVLASAAIAVLAWMWAVVWPAFLRGPIQTVTTTQSNTSSQSVQSK